MALTFANRGTGGIVGVDDLAVGQGLALREASRLVCDLSMGFERDRELGVQTRLLLIRQLRRAGQAFLGDPRQRQDRLSQLQQLPLGLAHQCHQHLPHPPALATKAPHHLLELVLEWLCVRLQCRAPGGARHCYGRDDLEDFFWA